MSINNIRKGFEGKGCQVALVIIGVLMVVGMIVTPGFFSMFGGKGKDPNDPVIAKVGGQAIRLALLIKLWKTPPTPWQVKATTHPIRTLPILLTSKL
ncbi:MAG: hypothetical protein R2688_06845 [Fimbriimonadaceae bacterium]